MCKEVSWSIIPFNTDYMIGTDGNVKSLKGGRERIIRVPKCKGRSKGRKVKLYKNGKYNTINVSTIMGIVFLGAKKGQMTKHINNDVTDDRLENLFIYDKGIA